MYFFQHWLSNEIHATTFSRTLISSLEYKRKKLPLKQNVWICISHYDKVFFVLKSLISLVGIPCRYPWALFPLLTSFVLLTFNPASSCSITMILCASQDFANGGNFKASIKINFWRTLNAKLKKKATSFLTVWGEFR